MAGDYKKRVIAKKLPPTENSFCLYLQRVVDQLMVWRQATQAIQNLPNSTDYGNEKGPEKHLQAQMMSQSHAAPELLNDLICDCTENSCANDCTCYKHGQSCTAACDCGAALPTFDVDTWCNNPFTL